MSDPNQLTLNFDCQATDLASAERDHRAEKKALEPVPQPIVTASASAVTSPKATPARVLQQPLAFTIKVSARARQVYLRAVPGRGLVVTIPKRFPKRDVPGIVEKQRKWCEEALADLDAQVPEQFRQWPPRSLPLIACNSHIAVEYVLPTGNSIRARWKDENNLLIEVDQNDKVAVASCVAAALKHRAKQILAPWLARLATDHGFSYKRLVVRGQRSVWGSYSSSGTLSLNYKLMFLSPHLVEYVLLHELAHTKHLDHSAAFWRLLDQQISGARGIDRELHGAGNLVPPWLELAK